MVNCGFHMLIGVISGEGKLKNKTDKVMTFVRYEKHTQTYFKLSNNIFMVFFSTEVPVYSRLFTVQSTAIRLNRYTKCIS